MAGGSIYPLKGIKADLEREVLLAPTSPFSDARRGPVFEAKRPNLRCA